MKELTNIQPFKGGSVMWNDNQDVFKVVSAVPGVRGRTFKGEMAWSNASRYISDHFDFGFYLSDGSRLWL